MPFLRFYARVAASPLKNPSSIPRKKPGSAVRFLFHEGRKLVFERHAVGKSATVFELHFVLIDQKSALRQPLRNLARAEKKGQNEQKRSLRRWRQTPSGAEKKTRKQKNTRKNVALSHNQLKHLTALREKKYRRKFSQFAVEGEKMALEALEGGGAEVEQIFCTEPFFDAHRPLFQKRPTTVVTDAELKKISTLTAPNKVFAICKLPKNEPFWPDLDKNWSFALDSLQDPGNAGTLWRLADWFGAGPIFCLAGTVDFWNPKVIQASMGAFLRVPVFEIELADLLKKMPSGTPFFGAAMDGDSIFELKTKPASGLLAIGAEGAGLSNEVLRSLTQKISIPRGPSGGAESLNAGVAGGILMAFLKN